MAPLFAPALIAISVVLLLARAQAQSMNLPDGIENILGFVPKSTFRCEREGYFGDIDNDCRLFHLCQRNSNPASGQTEWRHWTYACGNQTMFNQLTLTCAFVDEAIPCRHASQFQYLNEVIHKPAEPFLTDADVTSGFSYYSNRIMSDGARARAFQDAQLMAQIGGSGATAAAAQVSNALAPEERHDQEIEVAHFRPAAFHHWTSRLSEEQFAPPPPTQQQFAPSPRTQQQFAPPPPAPQVFRQAEFVAQPTQGVQVVAQLPAARQQFSPPTQQVSPSSRFEFSISTNHQTGAAPEVASQNHFAPISVTTFSGTPTSQQLAVATSELPSAQFKPRVPTTTTTTSTSISTAPLTAEPTSSTTQATSTTTTTSTTQAPLASSQPLQLVQPTQSTTSSPALPTTAAHVLSNLRRAAPTTTGRAVGQSARRSSSSEPVNLDRAHAGFQSSRLSAVNKRASSDTPLVMRRSLQQSSQSAHSQRTAGSSAVVSSSASLVENSLKPSDTFQLNSMDFWRRSFDAQLMAPKFESLLMRRRV